VVKERTKSGAWNEKKVAEKEDSQGSEKGKKETGGPCFCLANIKPDLIFIASRASGVFYQRLSERGKDGRGNGSSPAF